MDTTCQNKKASNIKYKHKGTATSTGHIEVKKVNGTKANNTSLTWTGNASSKHLDLKT